MPNVDRDVYLKLTLDWNSGVVCEARDRQNRMGVGGELMKHATGTSGSAVD